MELTPEGKEAVENANKDWVYADWVYDEEAQKENERYLKNAELIKKMDELKYRYDVLEGEIRSIEFNKSRLPSKIIAHIIIILAFVAFWAFFLANNGLSIFIMPFYFGALIAEFVKIYKDFKPYIINLPIFEDVCKRLEIKTIDISLEEKKIEMRALRGTMAELDKQIEKRSMKGEDMIS